MKLKNKNIFITGANRGIGLQFALEASRANMNVHLVCRKSRSELEARILEEGACSVRTWELDLSKNDSIDSFVEKLNAESMCPDILINNAGLLTGGLLEEQNIVDIEKMLQVNLFGLIKLTHALLPQMLKLEKAKVVNNASVMGKAFIPCGSTYSAAKAGVVAFTQSLGQELKGTSVDTLLLVTPAVKTDMLDKVEDIYSKNLDLTQLQSISSESWAKRAFEHIKRDKSVCWPSGFNKATVKLGHHFPGLSAYVIGKFFKRV